MDIAESLSQCLVMNTVVAARTLLRRYDAQLKPYGVTVQQFSLLGSLRQHPRESVAEMASRVRIDRTSLTRNLDLLERKGLVRRIDAPGKIRLCELTKAGDKLLGSLIEEWKSAQAALLAELDADDAEAYLRVSKHMSNS